jgi:hypothetical protein
MFEFSQNSGLRLDLKYTLKMKKINVCIEKGTYI